MPSVMEVPSEASSPPVLQEKIAEPGILHVIHLIGVGDRVHLHQFGAVEPDRVLLLLALGSRDNDGASVAARLGDHGQADAGVAGRAFDDAAAGPQQPPGLGVAHHVEGRAVLHGLPRVHELGLAEYLAAGQFTGAIEADDRRIADGVQDGSGDGHGRYLSDASAL
jgi:hypothetical protein